MTPLESSAWPLACGSACVFVLAVALDRLPWQPAFAAVVLAVAVWAWRSPLVVGAALGVVAWMCVTGFDVHRLGDIRVTGWGDAARAAVLVATGVLVALVHLAVGGRRADPVGADLHETGLGLNATPGDRGRPAVHTHRLGVVRQRSHSEDRGRPAVHAPRTSDRGSNDG